MNSAILYLVNAVRRSLSGRGQNILTFVMQMRMVKRIAAHISNTVCISYFFCILERVTQLPYIGKRHITFLSQVIIMSTNNTGQENVIMYSQWLPFKQIKDVQLSMVYITLLIKHMILSHFGKLE